MKIASMNVNMNTNVVWFWINVVFLCACMCVVRFNWLTFHLVCRTWCRTIFSVVECVYDDDCCALWTILLLPFIPIPFLDCLPLHVLNIHFCLPNNTINYINTEQRWRWKNQEWKRVNCYPRAWWHIHKHTDSSNSIIKQHRMQSARLQNTKPFTLSYRKTILFKWISDGCWHFSSFNDSLVAPKWDFPLFSLSFSFEITFFFFLMFVCVCVHHQKHSPFVYILLALVRAKNTHIN